jgi:DNA-binding PucR family transcriptional regulator
VRYRLAQLRDIFGSSLDDPRARFELSLAVRARFSSELPAGNNP